MTTTAAAVDTTTIATAAASKGAGKGGLPLAYEEKAAFEAALKDIEIGGATIKKAIQIAVRYATKAALFRKDAGPVNALQDKLDTLESKHYAKLLKKNFAAWCGFVNVVFDPNKGSRFYYKTNSEAPFVYSNTKGKKGWTIVPGNFSPWEEIYNTHFKDRHFASLPIEVYVEKKSLTDHYVNYAKSILDIARATKALPQDPIWEDLDPQTKKILETIAVLID